MILRNTDKSTSSAASADGPLLFDGQDGPKTCPSGQEAAPVSHSAAQEREEAPTTSDTSGPSCGGSSSDADRRTSLANRSHPQRLSELSLRLLSLSRFGGATMPKPTRSPSDLLHQGISTFIGGGLTEYKQTWKQSVTPCGLKYWAHIASVPRISDSGCSGWATPRAQEPGTTSLTHGACNQRIARSVVGWATPKAADGNKATGTPEMAWRRTANPGRGTDLGIQVLLSHASSPLVTADDVRHGVAPRLNPAFSLWLMGFPVAWHYCGERAMRSFRR